MTSLKYPDRVGSSRRWLFLAAFAASGALGMTGGANSASFVVTNADFVGGVYDFQFKADQTNRTFVNGVDKGIANPALTNSGWVCCRDDGPRFWHAQGGSGDFAQLTSGALTMGWDFSAVTGKILKVELKPQHFLFQFDPWNPNAAGDQIAGFVSTPGSFGAGPYTQLYSYTGTLGNTTTVGAGTLVDYAGVIGNTWLNDPSLVEFKFTYAQTPNPTIPAAHLELFRSYEPTPEFNFIFRVTLEDNAAVPLPGALPLFAGGLGVLGLLGWRRRRRA
jgi:hypothetical protein